MLRPCPCRRCARTSRILSVILMLTLLIFLVACRSWAQQIPERLTYCLAAPAQPIAPLASAAPAQLAAYVLRLEQHDHTTNALLMDCARRLDELNQLITGVDP